MQASLFQMDDITYTEGSETLLSIKNFEFHRGIIYAVGGNPGSGKSTLLEILALKRKYSGGTLLYEESPVMDKTVARKFAGELTFLPQVNKTPRKTVRAYLQKSIRIAEWSNDTVEDRLEKASKRLALEPKLDRKLSTLSPGEFRWITLAACLTSDTKVLIIDELEQHLSYDGLEMVKRMLVRKCNVEGTSVILSTLNLNLLRRVATVSFMLDRGRIALIRSSRSGGARNRRPTGPSERSRRQGPRSKQPPSKG